jgi:LacI family transcriptional regulator, gluconate utilization system Gnt-I transcriptional repressor
MTAKEFAKKPRKTTGAITLKEVANLAGVSTISVSRAINSPSLVTPKLLEKIQGVIEQTGYVPNKMAGGLASSKSKLIAAIVPSTVISVFNETIESLNGTLFDSGYQLMLGQSSYSIEREELLLESIIGRRPDGIFLTGVLQAGKGRNRLIASGIPVVETWDLTPTPIDMLIGFSHSDIGTAVAKFFIDKDHQNFAIVTADDERAARRTSAFCKTITDAGFKTPFSECGDDAYVKTGPRCFE